MRRQKRFSSTRAALMAGQTDLTLRLWRRARWSPLRSSPHSSTEPASTDLPSPEAMLTTEQRLHYLRLALAAPDIPASRLQLGTPAQFIAKN
eukprot:g4241.t1